VSALAEWADAHNVHYQTARKWFHAGHLPAPATQVCRGGKILIGTAAAEQPAAVIYARVPAAADEADLERQVAAGRAHCQRAGLRVACVVREIGTGLSGERPKLRKLLSDPDAKIIVVSDRERVLSRGGEIVEASLTAAGRRLVVAGD
jgi:putative resolvase